MISLINSFIESNNFDKLNAFIAKKIFKIFKIFFVKSKLTELPEKNYFISKDYLRRELVDGINFKKIKPYITYTHLIDLISVIKKDQVNFFDYGAGNLNLFYYLLNKFKNINYYFFDQPIVTETLKDYKDEKKLDNLMINPNLEEIKIDLVYFGSSLQYLKNYKQDILKFKNNSEYLIISQSPFFKNKDLDSEFIILKQINMHPNINFLYAFNYYYFIDFMKKNNFVLVNESFNRVTKFLNFKNFKDEYKQIDMYDLFFKKI